MSFEWLDGGSDMRRPIDLNQRIDFLQRYLADEPLWTPLHHVIRSGLTEWPLPHERETYKKFLELAAAAAWREGLDLLVTQCYQMRTGKRLSNAARAINHPAIRAHISQLDAPSVMSLCFQHDWDRLKAWSRRIMHVVAPKLMPQAS